MKGEPEGYGGGSQLGDWRGEGDIRGEGGCERISVDGREGEKRKVENREMMCERYGGPEGQNTKHRKRREKEDSESRVLAGLI